MKPTIIVLDIGDVVLDVEWSLFAKHLELRDEIDLTAIRESRCHDLYERGQIAPEEFFKFVQNSRPEDLGQFTLDKIRNAWNAVLPAEIPGILELVADYSKRHAVVALSNTTISHVEDKIKKFPVFRHFRHIYTSFEFGFRKPEIEIYQSLIHALNCKPADLLFVDDRHENVIAARDQGLNTHQCYRSAEKLREIFRENLS